MSGYLEYNSGSGEFLKDGYFLQKPFTRETLASKVDEALTAKNQQGVLRGRLREP